MMKMRRSRRWMNLLKGSMLRGLMPQRGSWRRGGWGEDQRFGGTGLLWEFSLLRSRDSVRLDWDYL